MSLPILALDAAGAACSAALWRDGRVAAYRRRPMQRGHAEALMPLLLEVLAEAGMDFAGLGQIAVGVGPGSFTGIRIALAAARGVGLAAKLPVLGVDSFSAVAAALPEPPRPGESLLVVIDSKREALFGQYYDDSRMALGEP
ncbi:MAG TPA: tRNA (adenosine(37)-N6)-threonylcarbamoyltransferase complex dimerization subunit type 1 TsaB, partial [Dongiaceae bacterium]